MKMVIFGDEPKSWPEEILSNFQFSEHTLRLWAYQNSNQPKPFEYITNKVESVCAQKLASRSIVCSRYKMNTTIQLQFLCVQSCSFICLDFSIFKTLSISFQLCSTVSFRLTLFGRFCSSLFGLARKNYVSGRWRPHMNWCCYLQNHFVESWRFLWHIFSLDSLTRYTQCWITKTVITGCIDYVGCFSHCFFSILFSLLLSFILRSLSAFSSLSLYFHNIS